MEDGKYLNILATRELNKNKYDFVFYVAEVDIREDRLGKLKFLMME